jgi:hypothetical protein
VPTTYLRLYDGGSEYGFVRRDRVRWMELTRTYASSEKRYRWDGSHGGHAHRLFEDRVNSWAPAMVVGESGSLIASF